jgi:FKBP-type peptidyl-prolyl cis-trans isomerase SlyD
MDIRNPCVVSLTWRLEDAQGELIDELNEPMEFFVGGDDLLSKVEAALMGQTTGFETTLHIEPEDAFGDYESALVFFEPSDIFPVNVEEGMQFEGPPEGAKTPDMPLDVIYTVTEVYDTHVVLDGNHPLAGIALVLSLKVMDVRAANAQEIERRSVGDSLFSLTPPQADLDVPPGTTMH